MTLYCYFAKAKASKCNDFPDPGAPLSTSISPAAIKDTNDAVKGVSKQASEAKGAMQSSHPYNRLQSRSMPLCMVTKLLFDAFQSSLRLN